VWSDAAGQVTGSCVSAGSSVWEDCAADQFGGFGDDQVFRRKHTVQSYVMAGLDDTGRQCPSDCARGLGRMARSGGAGPLSTPIAVEAVANGQRSGCQHRQKSVLAKAGVMSSIMRRRNRVIVISLRSRIGWVA
jgi:hypothetical protein